MFNSNVLGSNIANAHLYRKSPDTVLPHERPRVTLDPSLNVSIIVPWSPGCPHRETAWVWVRARLAEVYPSTEVIEVACGFDKTFEKARALREGAKQAKGDILVVMDADVWSPNLAQAIDAVAKGAKWCNPALLVTRLDKDLTARVFSGQLDLDTFQSAHGVNKPLCGGVVVMSRETFEACPPDVRFRGWGVEDEAWGIALGGVVGPATCFRDMLWHLYHPRELPEQKGGALNPRTAAIYEKYLAARGNAAELRRLVEESRLL